MGKKNYYVDPYEGAWRPEDMDAMDEAQDAIEEAEVLDGMRIFDPGWSDDFLEKIAIMCANALEDGMTEAEAIEEVAAQTGYSTEEITEMWEEFRARLQR